MKKLPVPGYEDLYEVSEDRVQALSLMPLIQQKLKKRLMVIYGDIKNNGYFYYWNT